MRGRTGERPSYGRLGVPAARDQLAAVRAAALETLDAVVHGRPIAEPRNTKRPWHPRYFIRRSAWHALDHAWEIEDRIED